MFLTVDKVVSDMFTTFLILLRKSICLIEEIDRDFLMKNKNHGYNKIIIVLLVLSSFFT